MSVPTSLPGVVKYQNRKKHCAYSNDAKKGKYKSEWNASKNLMDTRTYLKVAKKLQASRKGLP